MAPPKTMVMSQQQTIGQPQQPQQQQADQLASSKQQQGKAKKRKSKQPQPQQQAINNNQANNNNQHQIIQNERTEPQANNDKKLSDVNVNGKENLPNQAKLNVTKLNSAAPTPAPVVPSERTTIKKQQQQQVSPIVKEPPVVDSKRTVQARNTVATAPAAADPIINNINNTTTNKHQQLTNEEPDDIDAGIELDGSSNSGSSVKDISEDQIKSNSVSPVMAQSNLLNESCIVNAQPIAEITPIDQTSQTIACSAPTPAKKISTTKQQLAANQQVIDADEQLLQEKLQIRQKKSLQDNNNSSSNQSPENVSIQRATVDKKTPTSSSAAGDKSAAVQPPPLRRRFSSQSSQETQDGSLCKICEQHVYQMERMMAEKSVYHKKCFRCHQCKIQLRVDNYSSHEGQVYCKAHHRQIFQPQVKLDTEDDVDIVAKSTPQSVDDYLLHRGRLSELSFLFLQQTPEGIQKRQMIICENEPAELPKDVIRSNTKLDDGIEQLNLNLSNIKEKFERRTTSQDEDSQPSSAGVVIEKPSFNIKQTLMAFESRLANGQAGSETNERADHVTERPIVKKLTNLNGFFKNSIDADDSPSTPPARPLPVKRSGSLMMRLKKYESRIAGEQVDDDDDDNSDEDENNNKNDDSTSDLSQSEGEGDAPSVSSNRRSKTGKRTRTPKKLTSINLSSLKSQWENGDISKRRFADDEDELNSNAAGDNNISSNGANGDSGKNEELYRIRQQLAQKKLGESGSVRNIYENAIREAQLQKQASRRDSSDLSQTLNGFSKTTDIQQQLLQNSINGNNSNNSQNTRMPSTPQQIKDHFHINSNNRANKLREKFELGLINNSSHDDSDPSDSDATPALTKLEQIRQEKLEDLSVFTDGEIKAREARSLFQQIDRRISAATGAKQPALSNSRSLASIGASMRAKLTNQMNANNAAASLETTNQQQQIPEKHQPIRLTNNVRT